LSELISRREAAEFLRLNMMTIRRYELEGRLRSFKTSTGRVRLYRAEVEKFANGVSSAPRRA
jgi:excisionase family DNA binding protein